MTASRPGILLDRDGTIIVDHGYVGSVDRVEFIDGAAEAIASFNAADVPVAVVTNQSGVARGLYGLDDVDAGARAHRRAPGQPRRAHRPLRLLPVSPGRGGAGVQPHQRGPQAQAGNGQGRGGRPRPRPEPPPGSWATGRKTSASRDPSGRPRPTWVPTPAQAPVSGRSRASPPRRRSSWAALRPRYGTGCGMSSHYDPQDVRSLAAAAAAVKFPGRAVRQRRSVLQPSTPRRWRAPARRSTPRRWRTRPEACSSMPTRRGARMFSCGNGGSAADREPHAMRPREGDPDRHRPRVRRCSA